MCVLYMSVLLSRSVPSKWSEIWQINKSVSSWAFRRAHVSRMTCALFQSGHYQDVPVLSALKIVGIYPLAFLGHRVSSILLQILTPNHS